MRIENKETEPDICHMFRVDHSACLKKDLCKTDPLGHKPGHDLVVIRRCPNRVEKGSSFCKGCGLQMDLINEKSRRLKRKQ